MLFSVLEEIFVLYLKFPLSLLMVRSLGCLSLIVQMMFGTKSTFSNSFGGLDICLCTLNVYKVGQLISAMLFTYVTAMSEL